MCNKLVNASFMTYLNKRQINNGLIILFRRFLEIQGKNYRCQLRVQIFSSQKIISLLLRIFTTFSPTLLSCMGIVCYALFFCLD